MTSAAGTLVPSVVAPLAAAVAPLARGAFPILLDSALKGAALVAVAAATVWLLRRRSAAARHAAWTAAVVAHLALPVLTLLVPGWRLPFLPAPPWLGAAAATVVRQDVTPSASTLVRQVEPAAVRQRRPAFAAITPAAPVLVRQQPSTVAPATSSSMNSAPAASADAPRVPPLVVAALLWAAGALLVLLRLAAGTWAVGRLASRGDRVEEGAWLSLSQRVATRLGVARPITLLRGRQLAVPVTWGVVYPVVLLPPDADAWPEERRRLVLVHEMAHVQRFDALTQLLAQAALAAFWFDPLLWHAAHRMRVEREQACDDVVLQDGTAPSRYAGELLEMVRSIGGPEHERAAPAFAALAMARTSEFEGRMLAILDPHHDRHPATRRGTVMTVLFVALLAVPLAALRPFQSGSPIRVGESASAPSAPSLPSRPSRPSRPAVSSTPAAPSAPATPAEPATPATARSPLSPTSPTSPTSPLSPTSTRVSSDGFAAPCDGSGPGRNFRGTSINVHSDGDDDLGRSVDYVTNVDDRCKAARIRGPVTLTDDEHDVARLGGGASLYLRERGPGVDREVRIFGEGTAVQHEAKVGGRPAEFDAAARAWMAELLPEVVREAAINVPQRVARLRAAGGVPAVLAEIGRIHSGGAKRTYYEALFDGGKLSEAELTRVTQQASRDLTSSGDLASVLRRIPGGASTAAGRAALTEAIGKVSSSGDRRETLARLVPTADREMLLQIARSAAGITSSGDRAELLRTSAPQYLSRNDAGLRAAWFELAATLTSSGDLAEVLRGSLAFASTSPEVAVLAVRSTSRVTSSGDAAEVLLAVARRGLLRTPAVREAYLAAAKGIQSSGDYRAVMDAADAR